MKFLPIAASVLAAASLAGCGTMSEQFSGQVVTVDGKPFFVTKPTATPNFYRGMPDNTILDQGRTPRPEDYARNVRAIEMVTGCPVIVTSIENTNGYTAAAIACPAGVTPKY